MTTKLIVNEIFGPTFQGEGRYAGQQVSFLRLAACNLACSWCDTPYTWDWKGQNGKAFSPVEEAHAMELEDVAVKIRALGAHGLVISGGEPMLQQDALDRFVSYYGLESWMRHVQIETNGTQVPIEYFRKSPRVHFNVSPKLATSSADPVHHQRRLNSEAINEYRVLATKAQASFKFVVNPGTAVLDFEEIDGLVHTHALPRESVWIMPQGITAQEIVEGGAKIADLALAHGYNMTLRMQTLLWGSKRAR